MPAISKTLTPRERAMLDYIKGYIILNGAAPPIREIGMACALPTDAQTLDLLHALEEAGCLRLVPGEPEPGIVIVGGLDPSQPHTWPVYVEAAKEMIAAIMQEHGLSWDEVYEEVKRAINAMPPGPYERGNPERWRLSDREREVVALMAKGYTSWQMAEALSIDFETVRSHKQHIYKKLGSREQAIAWWEKYWKDWRPALPDGTPLNPTPAR